MIVKFDFTVLLGILCLGLSCLSWLLIFLDPVLVGFALYFCIILSGIYALFPHSNPYIFTVSILVCVALAVTFSHYSVSEGVSALSLSSLKAGISVITLPLAIAATLILISFVRQHFSRSTTIEHIE